MQNLAPGSSNIGKFAVWICKLGQVESAVLPVTVLDDTEHRSLIQYGLLSTRSVDCIQRLRSNTGHISIKIIQQPDADHDSRGLQTGWLTLLQADRGNVDA